MYRFLPALSNAFCLFFIRFLSGPVSRTRYLGAASPQALWKDPVNRIPENGLPSGISCLPVPLAEGDLVGVVAPAGSVIPEKIQPGVRMLESLGLRVRVQACLGRTHRYLAGTDEIRSQNLMNMLTDPDIRAVFCARGGYGSLRLLPLPLLPDLPPKLFMGYSDITALLHYLSRHAGWICLHGPVMASSPEPLDASARARQREAVRSALFSPAPVALAAEPADMILPGFCGASGPDCDPPPGMGPEPAIGITAGGNLTSLCHLLGTPWQPDFSGCILFLEDIGEPPYKIDRMLTQLRLAGCLDGVAGVALGRFTDCGDHDILHDIFREIFGDLGPKGASVLVMAEFPIGHAGPNHPLPLGIPAELDPETGILRCRISHLNAADARHA